METLSEKRKGEIAWALAKRKLGQNGIPLGGRLSREAGNFSDRLHFSKKQIVLFYKQAFAELFEVLYPDVTLPGDYKTGLPELTRNSIALEYINSYFNDAIAVLEKERVSKEISNISKDTKIPEDELWPFFGETLTNLFKEGMKIA